MSEVTTVLVIVLGWIGLSIPTALVLGALLRRPVAVRVRANGSLERVPLG